jgi:O-antigen/teichoic acid export membrane protein
MSVGFRNLKALPALLGIQSVQYIIPLLTITLLLRVLGLEKWGQISLLMAFGQMSLIVLEYGFHMSATQAAARIQDSPRSLAELFGAVTAAKLLIGLAAVPVLCLTAVAFPHLADNPSLLAWAMAATLLQAHDPLWFFLGKERPNRIAVFTILTRLAAVAAMFVFIRGPDDAWIYFLMQAAAWLCVFSYGTWLIHRETGFSFRDLKGAGDVIVRGRHFFQLYLGSNIFDSLLPLVLGAVSDPVAVGIFVGADKLVRAAAGLLAPFRNALFPRITALIGGSRDEAARLLRWAILRVGGLATAGGLILLVVADPLVHRLLGSEAAAAATVLRVLCVFLPLVTLNSIIGVQWMIPCGMERALRNIYIAAGLVRLSLCALLGLDGGALGAAISVLCGEAIVLFACLVLLRRRRLEPWRSSTGSPMGNQKAGERHATPSIHLRSR